MTRQSKPAENPHTFGGRLRTIRLANGVQLGAVARAVSVSFAYVCQIETGVNRPPDEPLVDQLLAAVGASVAEVEELRELARPPVCATCGQPQWRRRA